MMVFFFALSSEFVFVHERRRLTKDWLLIELIIFWQQLVICWYHFLFVGGLWNGLLTRLKILYLYHKLVQDLTMLPYFMLQLLRGSVGIFFKKH